MSPIETGSLLVLVAVGVGITYFGYETTQALLTYGGMAAGAAIGGWVGLVFAPQVVGGTVSGTELLVIGAVATLVGAAIGRSLIPSLGRLAVTCVAFTLSAAAALVFVSAGGALETLTQTVPRVLETGDPDLLYDRFADLEFVAGIEPEFALLCVLGVAAAGAGLAIAHADFVITAVVTVLGALLLGAVVPLLVGGVSLDPDAVSAAFSELWFLFFLVTGIAFEAIRYSDEIDLDDLL